MNLLVQFDKNALHFKRRLDASAVYTSRIQQQKIGGYSVHIDKKLIKGEPS